MGPAGAPAPLTKTRPSEEKLQAQLNRARSTRANNGVGRGDIRSGTTATEVRSGRIVQTETVLTAVGISKVRMIENVEELRAELSAKPLSELPVLCNREIEVTETRIGERVAAHVAELTERRRNHDRVAFGIATEQIESRDRGPRRITSVQSQSFRVASRVVSGIRLTMVAGKERNRRRPRLEVIRVPEEIPTDGTIRWGTDRQRPHSG